MWRLFATLLFCWTSGDIFVAFTVVVVIIILILLVIVVIDIIIMASIVVLLLLLLIPALCRGVLGDGWAVRRIWPIGWGSVKRILHVQFSA